MTDDMPDGFPVIPGDGPDDMPGNDAMALPDWLNRSLTEAQREAAWIAYLQEHLDMPERR
jgi:hypothetical protein